MSDEQWFKRVILLWLVVKTIALALVIGLLWLGFYVARHFHWYWS